MTVIHSEDVLLQDMYVNNTSHDSCCGARNTDGLDTMFSNNIHINRWTIVNGDDSISTKANSTNILVTNCTFYNGLGFALGSIGQYKDSFETLENITVRDIIAYNTLHAAYVKTWTGQQVGYPPNGGGGGFGCKYSAFNALYIPIPRILF
jgi:galacturan 1,4-alpha-galacturonidase